MKNISVRLPLVDGGLHDMTDETETGKQFIQCLFGDDWGAPPRSVIIEAVGNDGKRVTISVPYDDSDKVYVTVEDV